MVLHEGLKDGRGFDGVESLKDAGFSWTLDIRFALFDSFGHRAARMILPDVVDRCPPSPAQPGVETGLESSTPLRLPPRIP